MALANRLYLNMDSLSIQFIKILDDILENNDFDCKKLIFKNQKSNKNDIYYYARDVLKCLNYNEEVTKLLSEIGDDNKFTVSELYEMYSTKGLKNVSGLNQELMTKLRRYEMKYVYVNKTGLYELILFSKTTKSNQFRDFVFKSLLSTLDNNYQKLLAKQKISINDLISINNQLYSDIKEIKSIGHSLLSSNEVTKNK